MTSRIEINPARDFSHIDLPHSGNTTPPKAEYHFRIAKISLPQKPLEVFTSRGFINMSALPT